MAKIDSASMTVWHEGDTIHADSYNKERDLIVAAVNDGEDTHYKKTETYSNTEVYAKGETFSKSEVTAQLAGYKQYIQYLSSFPTTPANGDMVSLTADYTTGGVTYNKGKVYQYSGGVWTLKQSTIQETINPGIQIVPGVACRSMFKSLSFQGRTLTNLLGRLGNMENDGWGNYNATHIADTSNFTNGTSSLKVTVGGAPGGYGAILCAYNKTAGKYYIHLADLKNGTAANIHIQDDQGNVSKDITDTTKFTTAWFRQLADTTGQVSAEIDFFGVSGTYGYADAYRIYEITQAEYDALTTMTDDEIAAKYPYVDDVKPVFNPWVIRRGKNLFPAFGQWTVGGGGLTTWVQDGPYIKTATVQVGAVAHNEWNYVEVPVIPNQQYTVGMILSVGAGYAVVDSDTSLSIVDWNGNASSTFNTGNSTKVRIYIGNLNAGAGTLTFTNPMLNLGSVAFPFQPNDEQHLFIQGNFHSNLDGSVADELYQDGNGNFRKLARFKEIEVDDSLNWSVGVTGTDYRDILTTTAIENSNATGERGVKYDGKILTEDFSASAADQINIDSSGYLHITVANADSGWGPDYTPTADEIKALILGWVMSNNFAGLYNGTGTKVWEKRYSGQGSARNTGFGSTTVNGSGVTTVPTTMNDMGYIPYKIIPQLSQAADESISVEGSIALNEGDNQVEMGAGVIVRESVSPETDGFGVWNINNGSVSLLAHRPQKILEVYKNSIADLNWNKNFSETITVDGSLAQEQPENYDQSAAYSATYFALDGYLLGTAPLTITAEYAANEKTRVDDTVKRQAEIETRVSVLESQKAEKQQPEWIAPTLLNGWRDFGGEIEASAYMKDSGGFVHFKMFLAAGTTTASTQLFSLPKGYRPASHIVKTCTSRDGTSLSIITSSLDIYSDGRVVLGTDCYNQWLLIEFSFLAEQ